MFIGQGLGFWGSGFRDSDHLHSSLPAKQHSGCISTYELPSRLSSTDKRSFSDPELYEGLQPRLPEAPYPNVYPAQSLGMGNPCNRSLLSCMQIQYMITFLI